MVTEGGYGLPSVRGHDGDWKSQKVRRSQLTGQVLDVLRKSIVAGRLGDGTKLTEVALAEELGVSRGPIRYALTVLEGEGLVQSGANGRVHVMDFGTAGLESLYATRYLLEAAGVQWGIESGAARDAIAKAMDALRGVGSFGPSLVQCDMAYHLELVRFGQSRFLLQCWSTLASVIESVIWIGQEYAGDAAVARTHEDIISGHLAMTEAILDGDVPAATEALKRHFTDAMDVRRAVLGGDTGEQPDG